MDNTIQLIHPNTFEEDKNYLFLERQADTLAPAEVPDSPIVYVTYTIS